MAHDPSIAGRTRGSCWAHKIQPHFQTYTPPAQESPLLSVDAALYVRCSVWWGSLSKIMPHIAVWDATLDSLLVYSIDAPQI